MAPHAADIDTSPVTATDDQVPSSKLAAAGISPNKTEATPLIKPLNYGGSLDEYPSFDVTSVIGREFPTASILEILKDDAKIRVLRNHGYVINHTDAISGEMERLNMTQTALERGVVFFRNQNDLTFEDQKTLGQKLGELTGKPDTSKLHRHALLNGQRGIAVDGNGNKLDDEISVISSEQLRKFYKERFSPHAKRTASEGWHADITFEHVPSDYAILQIKTLPEDAGGDTLWASGYEVYDRLSPTWQRIADGLTATHYAPGFLDVKNDHGVGLIDETEVLLTTEVWISKQNIVRTKPVTGWKSIFGAGQQINKGWINDVTERESNLIKDYFLELIAQNHDLQVRFKWNKNDVAIWDNRSVFHTATNDSDGKRQGNRVVSIGEKPYFDPNSASRQEALTARSG
ncbi:TauD-domain-containing protein [Hyaloscypha bicolor E]|uniref:TauD-domain-containing protein n=1 Tax=Hyaloscypha bicolor E TaxID=1095630 RepID=A0A2J6SGE1_9HELO|nr:TauD-domain-containing protein [Hyaloscypha bicolor E]PMD49827.1 TauD-domain-containing protein [Hyaloscypha bicolor E]